MYLRYNSPTYQLRDRIHGMRREWQRLREMVPGTDPDTGLYDEGLIAGLCPKRCSCDVCRSARRADAGYQAYLDEKRSLEIIRSRNAVDSDLESRAIEFSSELRILENWADRFRNDLDHHKAKFNR